MRAHALHFFEKSEQLLNFQESYDSLIYSKVITSYNKNCTYSKLFKKLLGPIFEKKNNTFFPVFQKFASAIF